MMTESVDLTIVIRKTNGQLTVSTLPKSNGLKDEAQNHIVPLTVTGTPQELDTGFLQAVTRPIQKACGLISNMAQFEAQADKAAASSKAAKEAKSKETKEEREKREKYEKLMKKAEELTAARNHREAVSVLTQAKAHANAAQFTADIALATRASGTTWDNGDRIGITDIGNDTQYGNVPFILKNGKFEAEKKVIYIEDTKTHTFRAYYPYNAAGGILAATTDATAQQNQSAIDFLFATGATGDKKSPVVSFTDKTGKGGEDNSFHHRMSRITLTFEAGDGVDFSVVKPERYTLDGLLLTGTFNTADGIATADNGAQTGELAMNLADGVLTSSIILFPQTVASLPLVVNYKSQEYHATLTVPEGALQAGNNYTYTVKVRNKVLEVSEATIAKWNDIDGGEVGADL